MHTNAVKTLEALGINVKTVSEAQKDKELHKWINQGINAANKRATSHAQQVRYEIREKEGRGKRKVRHKKKKRGNAQKTQSVR